MNKLFKIIFCICCLFPIMLKADVCDTAKNDAAKVTASYKFMYKDGLPTFKITLNNVTKNIAFVEPGEIDNKTGIVYAAAVLSPYQIYIKVYDYNYTCSSPVRTITVKLPQYNEYSNMDVCKDIKNYKYCSEVLTEEIALDDLHDKVVNYKKELIKEDKIDTAEEEIEEQFKLSDDAKIYNIDKKNKKKVKEESKKENKLTFILGGVVLTLLIISFVLLFIYKKIRRKKEVEV